MRLSGQRDYKDSLYKERDNHKKEQLSTFKLQQSRVLKENIWEEFHNEYKANMEDHGGLVESVVSRFYENIVL